MAKLKDYGLSPGWQLVDTKERLSVRRGYLAAWARLLNASPGKPDHIGDFSVAPSRDDRDRRYGTLRALAKSGSNNVEYRCAVPNRKPSKITAAREVDYAFEKAASGSENCSSSFFEGRPFRLVLLDLGGLYGQIDTYVREHRSVLLAGRPTPARSS